MIAVDQLGKFLPISEVRAVGHWVNPFYGRDLTDPKLAAQACEWLMWAAGQQNDRRAPERDECDICGRLADLFMERCEDCRRDVGGPPRPSYTPRPYRRPWWLRALRWLASI